MSASISFRKLSMPSMVYPLPARDARDADADSGLAPQLFRMGIEGDAPVQEPLESGVGAEKIGGHRDDQGIRREDGINDGLKVIPDNASFLMEQADVTPPAGADVEIREPKESEFVGLLDVPADFLDHDLAVAQFSGGSDNAEDIFHRLLL